MIVLWIDEGTEFSKHMRLNDRVYAKLNILVWYANLL